MISLHWLILSPLIIGTTVKLMPIKAAKKIMVLFQTALLAAVTMIFVEVRQNGPLLENIGSWPDTIGITLRADLLATAMVFLSCFLFLAMVIFVHNKNYADHLFFFLFLGLESLIIGIFLSNDVFNIFVLIEAATLIITILIMYKQASVSVYDGMMYFLINVVAMSFFLMGLGMLYKKIGVLDFYALEAALSQVNNPASLILPYAFMITAISLKAALMPLFSWLPKAHGTPSAPSVVSAILSGLYVKTGIYVFLRLQTTFAPLIDTSELFVILGFITAVVGFMLALAQTDIKLLLAYSTVSQIGVIMIGISLNNPAAYWGGLYHQMDIKRNVYRFSQLRHLIRPNGNIGNKVTIHNIHMEIVGATLLNFFKIPFQIGKICTEHRWCYFYIHLVSLSLFGYFHNKSSHNIFIKMY